MSWLTRPELGLDRVERPRATASGSRTSQGTAAALPPAPRIVGRRLLQRLGPAARAPPPRAPRPAMRSAMERPSPVPPPVMTVGLAREQVGAERLERFHGPLASDAARRPARASSLLPVVALQLDDAVLHRASRAAGARAPRPAPPLGRPRQPGVTVTCAPVGRVEAGRGCPCRRLRRAPARRDGRAGSLVAVE